MPLTGEVDNLETLERIRNTPSDGQVDPEVLVMEPSPTIYSEDHLSRSVEASRFRAVAVKATGLRTQVHKAFKNMNGMIDEIKEIEQTEDENDEDSDYTLNLWRQVGEEFNKLMQNKSAHEDLVAKVRVMCGYMLEGHTELTVATKVQKDAKEALAKIEAAEDGLDKGVKDFKSANRRFIMGKKKKKTQQVVEKPAGAEEV